jgi:MSHA biogenesis protein MshJ
LFRHGIELTVSGAYLDLYEYLRTLERLPAQLYWGRAELSVSEYPSITLKLTLYTVSFDRAWLTV